METLLQFLRSPYLIFPTLLLLSLLLFNISPLISKQNLIFSLPISTTTSTTTPSTLSQQKTLFSPAQAPSPAPAEIHQQKHYHLPPKLTNNKNRNRLSSTERVEEDLTRARAAIHRAIVTNNFTSDRNEIYIPRGNVYRNPYAFHQSHIEMVKRFKIWSYREGDVPMVHSGPTTYIYSIEGHFIFEMESGPSPFLAQHPDEAHAFLLPLSVSKITDYLFIPHTFSDHLVRVFKDYILVIADKYPYWNRSSGADHFMVSCHDWASIIERGDKQKLYKNFMKVLCNANTSEGFKPTRDVSIPEYNLRAFDLGPPCLGHPPDKRPILAFFAGAAHGDIRDILFKHWKGKDEEVQVYEHLDKKKNYHHLMGQAKYCLCPSGSEVASPRVVEAMYAKCVPVLISDYYAVPFDDVLDWNKFSVQIPPKRIPEIKTILKEIPYKKYLKLQRRVVQVSKHFELNRPAKPFDVFHMVLHSIWLRRLNFKLPGAI